LKSKIGSVDQTYIKIQQDAHSDAVKLLQNYASDGDNTDLKSFAQQTLATLKMHQEMVENIASGASDTSPTTTTEPAAASTDQSNRSAPVPGANSCTQAQAKTRIEDTGYSNVSALTRDDKGIWRGSAEKD